MPEHSRLILHVDIDAFFASVEQLLIPPLRTRPVVVGSGCIASCSYEARRFGLHAGMSLRRARQLCPSAVILKGQYQIYRCFAERLWQLCRQYTNELETFLDEAYGDVTGMEYFYGDPLRLSRKLQQDVQNKVGLVVSIGLASNRMLAKLASSSAKPKGLIWVPPGKERSFVASLPIEKLLGIGRKTASRLRDLNIETVSQLRLLSRHTLRSMFGQRGEILYQRCRGRDVQAINPMSIPRTISRETTFHEPQCDREQIQGMLFYLLERAMRAVRQRKLLAGVVQLSIRYDDWRALSASRKLPQATAADDEVFSVILHLLEQLYRRRVALRHVGIVKALALIRPGAASIGMKDVFIRRHRRLEPIPQQNRSVDAILRSSNGVMLYEDDVMLATAALLGVSLPEADRFRKDIQNCRNDQQRLALSKTFLSRCRARGVNLEYAKSLWVQMAKFNEFSFCRAHAASYALLAYTGAYLKTHFPLEFWVSALNNNQSMYHPRVYVEQAKRIGIRFLLPDINRSAEEFGIEGRAIRVGLNQVGCLGPTSIELILKTRARRPYKGLSDFLWRTHLDRDKTRSLILCGAFDGIGRTRPSLMMELELCLADHRELTNHEETLFTAEPSVPQVPGDYSSQRKYADERQILDISVGRHIMVLHRAALAGAMDIDSRQLPQCLGRTVRIAGVLEAQRATHTQNGRV